MTSLSRSRPATLGRVRVHQGHRAPDLHGREARAARSHHRLRLRRNPCRPPCRVRSLLCICWRHDAQTAKDIEEGRKLGAEVARQLVVDLQNMGLPAVQAVGQPPPRVGDIVIKGSFVSVEEGSAGKRVLLGFGSGASDLRTVVEATR
jgi:hypothetical protein